MTSIEEITPKIVVAMIERGLVAVNNTNGVCNAYKEIFQCVKSCGQGLNINPENARR